MKVFTPISPACVLSHRLVNQLSVIVGNCELAAEKAGSDSDSDARLRVIRETAEDMANELQMHQCALTLNREAELERAQRKALVRLENAEAREEASTN